jgi:hypothetical protein
VTNDLTQDEIRRVRAQLDREAEAKRIAAERAKPSFLGWLGGQGFGFVVQKIIGWAWKVIKRSFGF